MSDFFPFLVKNSRTVFPSSSIRNVLRAWCDGGQLKCLKYDYHLEDSRRALQNPVPLTERKGSLCNLFSGNEHAEYFECRILSIVQKSNSLESGKENHRFYNKATLQVLGIT